MTRALRVVVAWLAVGGGVLLLPARADADRRFEPVREWIAGALASQGVPSLAVAVARDGEIVWEEGFGWADREQGRLATAHTPYPLASVSKPLTATAVLVLVEQGRVRLDAPANTYLGAAPLRARVGHADAATVRRVATHTAGLPLHHHFFHLDEPRRPPSIEETIRRYGNLVARPGERFRYSNLGYGVLEHLIEQVSGAPFEHVVRTTVFEPLGLRDTFVAGPGERPDRPRAVPYDPDGRPLVFYDFDHRGGSAMFGSAHDLVRFGSFHLNRPLPGTVPILSRRSLDEMHRPLVPTDTSGHYGLGWRIDDGPHGYRTISHSGGMPGVSTLLTLIPSERVAIAVLANSRTPLPEEVTRRILDRLLPRVELRFSSAAPLAPAPSRPPAVSPGRRFTPPRRIVGRWEGAASTYAGEVPISVDIHRQGEARVAIGAGTPAGVISARFSEGYLHVIARGSLGTPEADRLPHVLLLTLKLRGRVLNGAVTSVASPRNRAGYALSHWVELTRVRDRPSAPGAREGAPELTPAPITADTLMPSRRLALPRHPR
jgi:CubicO group peptidase (beta-lactamase class C family)